VASSLSFLLNNATILSVKQAGQIAVSVSARQMLHIILLKRLVLSKNCLTSVLKSLIREIFLRSSHNSTLSVMHSGQILRKISSSQTAQIFLTVTQAPQKNFRQNLFIKIYLLDKLQLNFLIKNHENF